VISVNYIGDSQPSETLVDVVAGSLPSAPINFKRATSVTPVDSKISIQWEAPSSNGGSAILEYKIFWNRGVIGGDTPQDYLASTSDFVTFHTQSGLTRGQTYKFIVAAENAVGLGTKSGAITLVSSQAPSVPTSITRLSFNSETTILIGWQAPVDNGGSHTTLDYQVYSDEGLAAGYTQISTSTNSLQEYLVPVITGRTYYFKIKAVNNVGSSGLSVASPGMLAGSVASKPLQLTLVTQSQFYIKFSWMTPEELGGIPLTQYKIYWDYGNLGTSDTNLFVQAGSKLPSETIYTQSSNVVSGITYQFFVIA
jgi:hypothetical protein